MTDRGKQHARAGNGLVIAYDIEGSGEPLLLIAGMSADRGLWAHIRPILNEHFLTIAFDNRDAGASDLAEKPYGLADLARDALAVMDAAGVKQAHVLGHSMGGAVAQELALLAPERVARLTLANTFAANDHGTREHFALIRDLRDAIENDLLFLRAVYFYGLGRSTREALVLSDVAKQLLDSGPMQKVDALKRQIDVLLDVNTLDRLSAIRAPTRVVWSPEDLFFCKAHAQAIAGAIPGSELVEVNATGHCPMIEAPKRFVSAVIAKS